jgi:hypothetical protein
MIRRVAPLLLSLAACSGDSADVVVPPPPVEPPPAVTPPPTTTPTTPGPAAVKLDLDTIGGANGAPAGMAFILPPGVPAQATAGTLSDGSSGFKLVATGPGDALVCTTPRPMGSQVAVQARLKLAEIAPGPQDWMGLNIELRARDAAGALVSPAGARYVLLQNLRAAGDWADVQAVGAVPAGASQGEICFRFVNSTGSVEVDAISLGDPSAPAPATADGAAPAPAGPVTRWELDQPGGAAGAPAGFSFLIPPGTAGSTLTAGPVTGGTGIKMDVTQAGNTLACSDPFPASPSMKVRAHVRLGSVTADARPHTGFVAEVRTFDAGNMLVSPAGSQYTTLATLKAPGDWVDVGGPFAPPPGAATGKLCFRFVESTGSAEIDWAEAGPG